MATNVFDLFAKISLDTTEYKRNLIQARTAFNTFVNGMSKTAPLSLKPTVKAVEEASQKIEKSVEDSAENIKEATEDASKESKKSIKEVLKDLETKAKESKGKINDIARNISDKMSNAAKKVKDTFSTIAKVGAGAVASASAGIGFLAKSSLDSYASYEQLVGGVETLFKDSADEVKKYADNAYKTAGMSANDYMTQATSFAGALLQSLGGDTHKAAEYADTAISDMSDNINKMGSDAEAVQIVYSGLSRGIYTTLDNLKLGYGGTKTEAQRLLTDAEKLNSTFHAQRDETGELAMNYADMIDAIHIVQQEMGITGTTSKEAASTIEGSTASMKAAWENLKIEIGKDNGDISASLDTLINGAITTAENIVPRVKTILTNIKNGLKTIYADYVPKAVEKVDGYLSEHISWYDKLKQKVSDTSEKVQKVWNYLKDKFSSVGDKFKETFDKIKDSIDELREQWDPVISKLEDYVKSGEAARDGTDFLKTSLDLLIGGINGTIDVIGTIIDYLVNFAGWITSTDESAQGARVAIAAVGGALATWMIISTISTLITGLTTVIETATAIWSAFNAIISANPIGVTIIAIGALIGALVALYHNNEDFRNFCNEWFDDWKVGIQEIEDKFNEFVDNWLTGFEMMRDAVNSWNEFWEGVGEGVYDLTHTDEQLKLGLEGKIEPHAKGGIFRRPTLIGRNLFGEAGAEAVIPLESDTEGVKMIADAISSNMQGTGTVNVYLDGATISSDYDVDRLTNRVIEKISEGMESLRLIQERGAGRVGG